MEGGWRRWASGNGGDNGGSLTLPTPEVVEGGGQAAANARRC